MIDPPTFRVWLKRRRIERGLTQEDLGELVGYAGQTIRKIEGGQRHPSLQLALRLAQALELGPDEQAAWMNAARAVAEPDKDGPVSQPLRPPTPSLGLPTYLTPFIGRAHEQAELATLLGRADCRLITVLGPGGVGKTRLAIETSRMIQGFTDGAAFVSLAPVAAPALIVPAIGDALGFVSSGTSDLLALLIAHLRDRRILLILDNLEHLLDPAGATLGLLERLLSQAPGVSILATSRERLRIAGEWVLELEGLSLPQAAHAQRDAAPALRLFATHAERVDRSFRLTTENTATITAICRSVDGLPLGIELAATWLRLLALEEIAQELARGFDTADLSPRTLPARHHSLRAVVDHSWQLLQARERQALRQLSAFQGGFSREAALQVAGADLGVLATLADKSLLRRGASKRYDLHEVIKQYAEAQLREHADEWAATHGRHAAYFLRFVAEREQRLASIEQFATMGEISAEIDNIRAAWGWAASHGLYDQLEQASEVLQWFYEFRNWGQEGAELFAQAVERLRTAGSAADGGARQQTLGRMLGHYGYAAIRAGLFVEAHDALAESYALLADGRDPVGLARTLSSQGSVAYYYIGDHNAARGLLDQSIALATAAGDLPTCARSQTVASMAAHSMGEYHEAERLFRAALANWRELGSPRGIIWCISYCSVALLTLGKHQEAELLLRESLALSHATHDRYGMGSSLRYLGFAALQQQDVETAIYFLREALPLLRSIEPWGYVQASNNLGAALWQAGATGEAERTYRECLAIALEIQAIPEALQAMAGLAKLLSHNGSHAAALGLAARVLADPVSHDELRRNALELRQAAQAYLSVDEAARIEQHVSALPLAAVLAELATLGSV